jgi:hypothetical protein
MRLITAALGCALLASLTFSTGCTRAPQVVPTYDKAAVQWSGSKKICSRNEVVSVAVTNNTPTDLDSTSTTDHTHHFSFTKDPELVYQRAFEESFASAGCAAAGELPALVVNVQIGQLVARPDGRAHVKMLVTLAEPTTRKALINKVIFTERERSCGLVMCGADEMSDAAKEVITESVMQTMAELANPISTELAKARS